MRMKMHKIAALALLAVVLVASGAAYADWVEGTVKSVDLTGKALEISKRDAAGGTTEDVKISVSDATTYSGEVTALEEVIEGDVVKIEAEKDAASGNWVAKSVDVTAPEE